MTITPQRRALTVLLLAGLTAIAGDARAEDLPPSTLLTFDELPFQSVDDLTVGGVTFDFKIDGVDSPDAFYNSFGPGTLAFVDDPSMTGDARGVLTLDFAPPAPIVEFGVALNTGQPLQPGLTVELFDATNQLLATVPVPTSSVTGNLGFSEAHFQHAGAPVARAVIQFAAGPDRFALDNLAFGVPEPSTLSLILLCLFMGAAASRGRLVNRRPRASSR